MGKVNYFCDKGGHELRKIIESKEKRICQVCHHYFIVDEMERPIKEINQREFYEEEWRQ